MKRLLIVSVLLLATFVTNSADNNWYLCIELNDGSVEEFLISDDYPRLSYENKRWYISGDDYETHRTLIVVLANGETKELECGGIRRFYVQSVDTGVADMVFDSPVAAMDVYSSNGQLVRSGTTTLEGLPKGVYVIKQKENSFKYISR
jgi:hypothetical protein